MAWPSAFVAGNQLTATQLNGIQASGLAWTSYVPTWTSSGTAVSLGNGTVAGRYTTFGKTTHFFVQLVIGSTTTVGTGFYLWSLPVTSLQSNHTTMAGSGNFFDTSATGDFAGWGLVQNSTTTVRLGSTAGAAVGAATPVVPATGDIITIMGTYEAL